MITYSGPTSPPTNDDEWRKLFQRDFSDWSVWRSDAGRWWATRHTPITQAEDLPEYARTVDANVPDELSRKLTDQKRWTTS